LRRKKKIRPNDNSFTLLLVSNSEKSVRRWHLPSRLIALLIVAVLGCGAGLIYFVVSYSNLAQKTEDLFYLEQTAHQQQKEMEKIKALQEELEYKLEEVDKLDNEVRSLLDIDQVSSSSASSFSARGGHNVERRAQMIEEGEYLKVEDIQKTKEELQAFNATAAAKIEELNALKKDVRQRLDYLASYPSLWPTKGRLTSGFGERPSPFTGRLEFHAGIDIANRTGTQIMAAGKGTVTFTGYKKGYGYLVTIDHGYGFTTNYAHLSQILVEAGQKVEKGEVIAKMGNTGRSTGPHLHFEILKEGEPVDPLQYLQENEEA
jgi:murein DD-endopeptidase MepM/ murein hydrolase activator NlpD